MSDTLVTKGYVKTQVEKAVKNLETRILETEVKILGELQKMREDNEAHNFSHMRLNEDVIDLENKVTKLESASDLTS